MATRLFVGNLPFSATADELRSLFARVGTVEDIHLPTDRQTGRPRGFGFVQMANDQEARDAIHRFDGYTLDGRQIRVDLAEERESRSGGPRPDR